MIRVVESYFAEVASLAESYHRLRDINPNHEWLKFAEFADDGQVIVDYEFLRNFEPKGWPIKAERGGLLYKLHTLANANEKLREAAKKVA